MLLVMRKECRLPPIKQHTLRIDDNSDTCALVVAILCDYEVTSAYSMADAVKGATASRFWNITCRMGRGSHCA